MADSLSARVEALESQVVIVDDFGEWLEAFKQLQAAFESFVAEVRDKAQGM